MAGQGGPVAEVSTVGDERSGETDMDCTGTTPKETQNDRKRLPSSSPETNHLEGDRSGSRKFAREDSSVSSNSDCIVMEGSGDSTATSGRKGSVYYLSRYPIDCDGNSIANSTPGNHPLNPAICTEGGTEGGVYQHEIGEIDDSLLLRLKGMVKSLDEATKVDVACQSNALYLTPLVKTLFGLKPMSGCSENEGENTGKDAEIIPMVSRDVRLTTHLKITFFLGL